MATVPAPKADLNDTSPNGPGVEASTPADAHIPGVSAATASAGPASATGPKREPAEALKLFNEFSQQLSQSYGFLERRGAQLLSSIICPWVRALRNSGVAEWLKETRPERHAGDERAQDRGLCSGTTKG